MNKLKRLKKINYMFILLIIFLNNSCYADMYSDTLKTEGELITKNLLIMFATVAGMFFSLILLGVMTKNKKSKFLTTKDIKSNKIIRFLEVILFIILLVFLAFKYIDMADVIYTSIGLITVLYAFYQRISNKNRKLAYITFLISLAFYLSTNFYTILI